MFLALVALCLSRPLIKPQRIGIHGYRKYHSNGRWDPISYRKYRLDSFGGMHNGYYKRQVKNSPWTDLRDQLIGVALDQILKAEEEGNEVIMRNFPTSRYIIHSLPRSRLPKSNHCESKDYIIIKTIGRHFPRFALQSQIL